VSDYCEDSNAWTNLLRLTGPVLTPAVQSTGHAVFEARRVRWESAKSARLPTRFCSVVTRRRDVGGF